MRHSIHVFLAITILACLAALLLMPGATTAVVVRTHPSGKQSIRFISFLSILALAAAVCQGFVRLSSALLHDPRFVEAHGFGPDLLDKTCVRLC
jgi:hypothetical protein